MREEIKMATVLIIDDDPDFCYVLSRLVRSMGHEAVVCHSLAEGAEAVKMQELDAVFLDVHLPDGNGLSLLPTIYSEPSQPQVIIITGAGDAGGAEVAIASGAWDYIEKGVSSKHITLALKRALEYRRECHQVDQQPARVSLRRDAIAGESPQINDCLDQVAQYASCDVNVLINGETGTGKELFARAIHENSARASGPFMVVDCAALPESLVESILFGHVKGAFTGADADRQGLVMQARQGTLFLDEVGELPPELQKAFLRLLEERRIRPLGGARELACDFRLVAATHRNLEQMTAQGAFRSDLFFRLQSVNIAIPPLRERPEDIRPIAAYHLQKLCDRFQMEQKGVSSAFFETLSAYPWPGNVRELINALRQALLIARNAPTLHPVHLPPKIRVQVVQKALSRDRPSFTDINVSGLNAARMHTLQQFREMACAHAEELYLKDLMASCRGRVKNAVRISGLSQSRLYALLKKYGITPTRS
jgi:two-component system NtrC family response regulator